VSFSLSVNLIHTHEQQEGGKEGEMEGGGEGGREGE